MDEDTASPRLMLVTDRRRLTASVGAGQDSWPDLLTAQIRGAIAGGVDLVQFREPDLDSGTSSAFLRALFSAVPGSQRRVVVNERVDVALAVGARGVHLPERALAVRDVRASVSGETSWLVGRSVHSIESVVHSKDASYLLAGTVSASQSKPERWPILGWDGLSRLVTAARPTPVLAIGGLDARDVPALIAAGAAGLAGIGCFLPSGAGDTARFVEERAGALRLAFDSQ
jgi:thiamine-phosphate pyrophosphorylase